LVRRERVFGCESAELALRTGAEALDDAPIGLRPGLADHEQVVVDFALPRVQLRHARSVRRGCDTHADCGSGRRRAWSARAASRRLVARGTCATSYQVKRPTSHPVAATTAVSRRASYTGWP